MSVFFSKVIVPFEEQDGDDDDDDEDDGQHWSHHPQQLWVLSVTGHPAVELHHHGIRVRAHREHLMIQKGREDGERTKLLKRSKDIHTYSLLCLLCTFPHQSYQNYDIIHLEVREVCSKQIH